MTKAWWLQKEVILPLALKTATKMNTHAETTKGRSNRNLYTEITLYFVLAYAISWVMWLPLYGAKLGLSQLPTIPFNHAIGAWGPMLAAFIMTWWKGGKGALTTLLKQCIRTGAWWYALIALFSPFVLVALAALIDHFQNGVVFSISGVLHYAEFPELNILTFFIYNLAFFGLGEEIGWRGYALPRLQVKMNALTAAILLTIFWALWHVPLFLYRPGYMSMGIAGMVGWVLSLATGSILLSWLYNATKAGILTCAIFHSTIDVAFTADFADTSVVGNMGMLITVWGILTIAILRPKNLSKSGKVLPDNATSNRD